MENISLSSILKFSLIRHLPVLTSVFVLSFGATASQQQPSEQQLEKLEGQWQSSGGRLLDSENNPRYTFDVTEPGYVDIRLENTSDACPADPYLYLIDEEVNDDWDKPDDALSDCIRNSRLVVKLTKGNYTLVAATFNENETADFTIRIKPISLGTLAAAKISDFKKQEIKFKSRKSISGSWDKSGGQDHRHEGNPRYSQVVEAYEEIIITLTSEVDTYLYLLNKDGSIFKYDDDGHTGYNSRIKTSPGKGEYTIVAGTYAADKVGNFTLLIESIKTPSKIQQVNFSAGEDFSMDYSATNNWLVHKATGGSTNKRVTYESSDLHVAVSLGSGTFRINGAGKATITATRPGNYRYHDATASVQLTVLPIRQPSLFIGGNKEIIYSANVPPHQQEAVGGADKGIVTYHSSNPHILPVNEKSGVVDILGVGETTITATKITANYYNISAEYKLTVKKGEQPDFSIGGDIEIAYHEDKYFWQESHKAEGGIENGKLTYSSSNPSLLPVDENNGIVNILGVGETTITVKNEASNYHDVEAQYRLTVKPGVQPPLVIGSDQQFTYSKNGSHKQIAKGGAEKGTVTYTSSNPSLLPVDENNGIVNILGVGETTITAIKKDPNYFDATAEYVLTVEPAIRSTLSMGEDIEITYTHNGSFQRQASGGSGDEPVTYSSSNPSLLPVDENNGKVFFGDTGKTTITAKQPSSDGTYIETGEYNLIVKPGSQVISFDNFLSSNSNNPHFLNKKCGESFTLKPKTNLFAEVDYESEYESVAKVDNNGKVTVVGLGNTKIIATAAKNSRYLEAKAFYELNIQEKGHQAIQFKGENPVLMYGETETYRKDIIDGWGDKGISYEVDYDESLLFGVDSSGQVDFDYDSAIDVGESAAETRIKAYKPEDSCYQEAVSFYEIKWQKNAIYPPKVGKTADKEYVIEWTMPDYNEKAKVKLYYSNFSNGHSTTQNPKEDPDPDHPISVKPIDSYKDIDIAEWAEVIGDSTVGEKSFVWDTSVLPEGDYYIFAMVENISEDCENSGVCENDYSGASNEEGLFAAQRPLVVKHDYGLAMDCSSMNNYSTDKGNAPNNCPDNSMALLNNKGNIIGWGKNLTKPDGKFSKIYPAKNAYAALDNNGAIEVWGGEYVDSQRKPDKDSFTSIYTSASSFAAKRKDGSIIAWNKLGTGEIDNVAKLISSEDHFIALKKDGSISIWDEKQPIVWQKVASNSNYIDIHADKGSGTFIALTDKGSVEQWTFAGQPIDAVPDGGGYIRIFASKFTEGYFAIRANGKAETWGMADYQTSYIGGTSGRRKPNNDPYSWEDFGLISNVNKYFATSDGEHELRYVSEPEQKWNAHHGQYETFGEIQGLIAFYEPGVNPEEYIYDTSDGGFTMRGDVIKPVYFTCETTRGRYNWILPGGCDLSSVPKKVAKILEMNKKYYARIWVQVDKKSLLSYHDTLVHDGTESLAPAQPHIFTVELDHRGLRRGTRSISDLSDAQLQDARVHSNADGFIVDNHDNLHFWGTQLYSPYENILAPVAQDDLSIGDDAFFEFGVRMFSNSIGTVLLSENDGSIDYISVNSCFQAYNKEKNCHSAPSDSGYINIYSTSTAFAGLTADGSITTWGRRPFDYIDGSDFENIERRDEAPVYYREGNCGEDGGPSDKGYISIKATKCSFTAIKADGTMTTWGTIKDMNIYSVPTSLE